MYSEILDVKTPILTLNKQRIVRLGDFLIPPSYQQFSFELGYGRLLELFFTYIPMGESNYTNTLEEQNAYLKSIFQSYLTNPAPPKLLHDPVNYRLIANAEPFLFGENGEVVFWDSEHPTADGECPIYLACFPIGIYFVGNNFSEFIETLTHPTSFKNILKYYNEALPPTFEPLEIE